MRSLWQDERGLTGAYLRVVISVIIVSLVWICMNEFVFRISAASLSWSTDPSFPGTRGLLLYIWRITPVVILIGTIIGAILIAHKERPMYG